MENKPIIKETLVKISIALIIVIFAGSFGYMLIEGWGFADSIYMTVITITTTGYGEVRPLSAGGRVLSVFVMFVGIGIFFYGLNLIFPYLVEYRAERWKILLKKMNKHYVIFGFGDMGTEVAGEMSQSVSKNNVVIVDQDPTQVSRAREKGYVAVQGNCAEEETLRKIGIEKAQTLIACTNDSDNAFAIMGAKELNPELYTIAIARTKSGRKNIQRAGADQILSPYSDTAKKAHVLIKSPVAAEFSEVISEIGDVGILQEVTILNDEIEGETLRGLNLRKKTGAAVLAIEREGKVLLAKAELKLELNDKLYLIGEEDQLKQAVELLKDSRE